MILGNSYTFATVKAAHSFECLTIGKDFLEPTERRKAAPNLGGFFVLRPFAYSGPSGAAPLAFPFLGSKSLVKWLLRFSNDLLPGDSQGETNRNFRRLNGKGLESSQTLF